MQTKAKAKKDAEDEEEDEDEAHAEEEEEHEEAAEHAETTTQQPKIGNKAVVRPDSPKSTLTKAAESDAKQEPAKATKKSSKK